jgi:hypothetical protein
MLKLKLNSKLRNKAILIRLMSTSVDLEKQNNRKTIDIYNDPILEDSYLKLINCTIRYLKLKDSKTKTLIIPFSGADLQALNDKETLPLEIRRFCFDIRVATNSSFSKNIIEMLLFPISKNIVLEEEALYLTSEKDDSFMNYKNLLFDDEMREASIEYIYNIFPSDEEGTITTRTTLKSFQKEGLIGDIVNGLKNNSLLRKERYTFVAIFLKIVLFEVVHNSRGKRSKSRIVNFLIDRLAKSGIKEY